MAAKQKKNNKTKSKSVETDPVQAAIDYGIDVSALIDNAGRSCTERIKRHQTALNTAKKLRKARKL
jgi:post-segregation antitoxin (ccd killing protein)